VDGSINWLIPILLFAFFYYRYRSSAKQMVRIFDALLYRLKNGRFLKANAATLQMIRRDVKLFITEHFANREEKPQLGLFCRLVRCST